MACSCCHRCRLRLATTSDASRHAFKPATRGMEDTLTLTQAHFSPAFKPHEETAFVRRLLSFAADKTTSKPKVGWLVW